MTINSTENALHLRSYQADCHVHQHDFHQLVLPLHGALELEIAQQGGIVSDTQGALIGASDEHAFSAQGDNRFIVADLSATYSSQLASLPKWFSLAPSVRQYLAFLDQVLRPSSQSMINSRESTHKMVQLLAQLLVEQHGQAVAADVRVDAARQYIEQHLAGPITMTSIAKAASLSPRHLNTLFQRFHNCTPQQYLLVRRMEKAEALLRHSELSIQQVAENCGYSNLSAFSDRVRRYFGCSPRDYRARYHG